MSDNMFALLVVGTYYVIGLGLTIYVETQDRLERSLQEGRVCAGTPFKTVAGFAMIWPLMLLFLISDTCSGWTSPYEYWQRRLINKRLTPQLIAEELTQTKR